MSFMEFMELMSYSGYRIAVCIPLGILATWGIIRFSRYWNNRPLSYNMTFKDYIEYIRGKIESLRGDKNV